MGRGLNAAIIGTALALAAAVTVASCIGQVGPGDACTVSSDCEQPAMQPTSGMVSTVCAFGRCHFECATASFCAVGSECVAAGATFVCTLPGEDKCSPSKPCVTPGLQCGPDDQCHTACPAGPCLPGMQTCTAGACLDGVADSGAIETGPADSGPADSGSPADSSVADSASEAAADTGATDGSHPTEAGPGDGAADGATDGAAPADGASQDAAAG
jgi:hypothetical protein